MKTFDAFDRPDGWASAAEAFYDDFAAGQRIQIAPWGGYAILGYSELASLARDPLADGMAPDPVAMADTPSVYRLIRRALFTKSGEPHRTERAATIAAFGTVPLTSIAREAVRNAIHRAPARIDLRSDLVAPVVRSVWGTIVGLDAGAALQLEAAVRDTRFASNVRRSQRRPCHGERAHAQASSAIRQYDAGGADQDGGPDGHQRCRPGRADDA